ncbi:MAG: baseplate J/gp47 family protein [Lachnospiraceae bacterium]|nr:baseplate J/gp47 family protein [Lachnospiraceae bacterium]
MLSEIVLDDEYFVEIAERARAQITDIEPHWTDHNVHDPGITILELFAWMKEMQQFHMDQIGDQHRAAYLRLLGITPQKKKAAEAVVRMDGVKHPVFFPQGSRFFAGEICFEALTSIFVSAEEITRLSACKKGHTAAFVRPHAQPAAYVNPHAQSAWEYDMSVRRENDMHFPAFGEHPEKGCALWMELNGALKPHITYTLRIRLSENGEFRRNPIGKNDTFYPLSELSLRYPCARGLCSAEIVEDTTNGLLESGTLRFRLGQEMNSESGKNYLRLVLERCEYDMPPMLAGISLHEQSVVQQRTIAEYHDGRLCGKEPIRICTYLAMTGDFVLFRREGLIFIPYDGRVVKKISDEAAFFFLPEREEKEDFEYRLICCEAGRKEALTIGEGSGLPDQTYEPDIPGLCAEGMCLMMETVKGSGRYLSAEHCDDLMQAGALDAVFFFEEDHGSIHFGDCDHGIPPEGNLLFAAARSSLGSGGNVKEGSIRRFEDGERGITVENRCPAAGGRNAETISESRERLLKTRMQPARAVTNEDFERLVLNTPGLMIESARVILPTVTEERHRESGSREACVTLVVKPCSAETTAYLSEAYRRNILRALEPKRMLGTRLNVLSPEYFGISVFAEIVAAGQERTARSRIEEAAVDFFREIRAVFGVSVRVSAVYGKIQVLDVVTEVSSLSLDAQGKGIRRSKSGNLILPPNGLPYLKECVLSISSDAGSCERQ